MNANYSAIGSCPSPNFEIRYRRDKLLKYEKKYETFESVSTFFRDTLYCNNPLRFLATKYYQKHFIRLSLFATIYTLTG